MSRKTLGEKEQDFLEAMQVSDTSKQLDFCASTIAKCSAAGGNN